MENNEKLRKDREVYRGGFKLNGHGQVGSYHGH